MYNLLFFMLVILNLYFIVISQQYIHILLALIIGFSNRIALRIYFIILFLGYALNTQQIITYLTIGLL